MGKDARRARVSATVPPPAGAQPKPVVILVHGIRDSGFRQQVLQKLFERNGYTAAPIGYGILDIARFLLGIRRPSVDAVRQQIKTILDANRGSEITIIAHSFGTYAVSRVLEDDPTLDVTRLILCGGIIRRGFRWDKMVRLNGPPNKQMIVINEHSAWDMWPTFARHFTFGFGDTGSIGCDDGDVWERRHDVPHGGYLREDFAEQFWLPLPSSKDTMVASKPSEKFPWYTVFTRLPFTLAQAAILGVTVFGALWFWDRMNYNTRGDFALDRRALDSPVEIRGYSRMDSERSEPIYSFNESQDGAKRKIFSAGNFDRIDVRVSKTLSNDCGMAAVAASEDGPAQPVGQSAPVRHENSWVTYSFDLRRAHRWFGKAQIEFQYEQARMPEASDFKPNISSTVKETFGLRTIDRLVLKASEGLNSDRIRVRKVIHNGSECLDDFFTPEAFVSIQPIDNVVASNGWFSLFAWAGEQYAPLSGDEISKMVTSKDDSLRAIGIRAVIARPADYGADINKLIVDTSTDDATLASLLIAARATSSGAIALDTNRVISLTYSDNADVRDAARSYLRAPGVVNDDIVNSVNKRLETDLAGLRLQPAAGRDYNKDYLLLIAARDVYYNLGIVQLDKFLGSSKPMPAELDASVATFEKGRALAALATTERSRIAMAKNTYGKAMAIMRGAMWQEALQQKVPSDYLEAAIAGRAPLKDKAAAPVFESFLMEIQAGRTSYPWPLHIAQAEDCLKAMVFGCLGGPASAQ